MKNILQILAILIIAGFQNHLLAGTLDLSSPGYMSDGATQPTWYAPVVRNSSLTFTVSPSKTLTSLSWVFNNSSTGTGSGNGPIQVKYDLDAGEGQANDVTFTTSRPDGGGGSGTCDTTGKTALKVVLIDIQYGTTSGSYSTDPQNAIVRLKNTAVPKVFNLPCQMRISAANVLPNDLTVCLVNGSGAVGQLGFSVSGDATASTLSLTLSKSGDWKNFNISGQTVSSAVGDAKLEVHKDSASGPTLGQNAMTVYNYDPSDITVGLGQGYKAAPVGAPTTYNTTSGSAVNFAASAYLVPAGLNLTSSSQLSTIPQLANIRIGICQAVEPVSVNRRIVYNSPQVTHWDPASPSPTTTPPGTTTVVPSTEGQFVVAIPPPASQPAYNDSIAAVDPLYDQPGKGGDTIDPNSLALPKVSSSGTELATSNDAPTTGFGNTLNLSKNDSSGHAATITYQFLSAEIHEVFDTWCVTYDTGTGEVIPLRQTQWSLNMISTSTGQHASVPSGDANVSVMPELSPFNTPYANDITGNSANYSNSEVSGVGTTTLSKP